MSPFLPVLAYQKIGHAPKGSRLKNQWTSPRQLEKMLMFLIKHRYTFITPAGLSKKLPARPVLLTFFGGYQSFYTTVLPLLQKYKVRATLFVATDTLGTYNSWQDPYQESWQNVVTQAQLNEIGQSKWVQIGTLGLTGKNLLGCEDIFGAREEILESIHRLKTLHKIEACAVGFWPWARDKNLVQTHEICAGLNLPVITTFYGENNLAEKQFLRIFRPNQIRLWTIWKSFSN